MYHDLLPVLGLRETAENTARRLTTIADAIEAPVAIENISYYFTPGEPEIDEATLIQTIVRESGAGLLLDVNNAYVNATNHGFDARSFMSELPLDRVVQMHVAGHEWRAEHDLIIDTHGTNVIDPVYELLEFAIERTGNVPVLLERDHAIPSLDDLRIELAKIRATCARGLARRAER